jgi:ribonuclease D
MPDPPSEVPLISTASGLRELADHLRTSGRFAFDTEFVSEESFEPVLCLVQVATHDRLVVVDPMAIDDFSPFWEAVTDPAVEVVMHAAGEDLRICRFQTGRLPTRVVDVQIAAGLVGYGYPLSLGNLVRQELGISLPGGETRTDWRRRPLSAPQLRYACDDVAHLITLADRLGGRIAAWGRSDWAESEYRRLIATIDARSDEDRWRRLPGLHQLSRRGLETARRLAEWRKEEAKRSNRPLRQIIRDDLLVAIAKRQPSNRRDLEALRDFNRPHLHAKSREILELINEAQTVPLDDLPEHAERHEEGPGLAMVVSLLAATLNQCCAESRISPALVGSSSDLKALVRWFVEECPEGHEPDLVRGWREEVCGRTLVDVLAGRRALRVVDPAADVPVALDPVSKPSGGDTR